MPADAQTGALCVTWRGRTECGSNFTVLTGPLLYGTSPQRVAVGTGEIYLDVIGDGFAADSEVWLDWQPLVTEYHTTNSLAAVLPASVFEAVGTHDVLVYSPSSGRCGTASATVELTVE